MPDTLSTYGVLSYITRDILVVPFQSDFYQEVMLALQKDISEKLYAHPEVKGLIIDLSEVNLIDLADMKALKKNLGIAEALGKRGYIVGIRPHVALALVELGYELGELCTALNVAQAIEGIEASLKLKYKAWSDEEDNNIEAADSDIGSDD